MSGIPTTAHDREIIAEHIQHYLLALGRNGHPARVLQAWYLSIRNHAQSDAPLAHTLQYLSHSFSAMLASHRDGQVRSSPVDEQSRANDAVTTDLDLSDASSITTSSSDDSAMEGDCDQDEEEDDTDSSGRGFEEPDLAINDDEDGMDQTESVPGSPTLDLLYRRTSQEEFASLGTQPFIS